MKFLAGSEKRFFDFISNLTDKDKIALLSHNDGDGIVSALIASKVLGKIDCPKLLKEATKDTPNSNAGGHHNAAGGTIPLKYLEQFKKSLFKAYDSLV